MNFWKDFSRKFNWLDTINIKKITLDTIWLWGERVSSDDFMKRYWHGWLDYFIKSISITEERFLSQPGLFEQIDKSIEAQKLHLYAKSVLEIMDKISDSGVQKKMKNLTKKISDKWLDAAKVVLKEHGGILNDKTVKILAADAIRQRCARSRKPNPN